METQTSTETLAFNFASRTFAYKRLIGLFSFKRHYLVRVIKTDHCAQYVENIGIAANDSHQFIKNMRMIFECIREATIKLTMPKCHFSATETNFLGRTITREGVKPKKGRITKGENENFQSPRRPCNDILVSLITTGIIFQEYQKN